MSTAKPRSRLPSPDHVRVFMAQRRWAACDDLDEICAFRALAARLIGSGAASVETLSAVQAKTRCALFLWRENNIPAGFLAFFPVTAAGETALATGAFSGTQLDLDWVAAAPFTRPCGYVWGLGAATPAARLALLRTGRAVQSDLFARAKIYTRPVTEAGARLADASGFSRANEASGPFMSADPATAIASAPMGQSL